MSAPRNRCGRIAGHGPQTFVCGRLAGHRGRHHRHQTLLEWLRVG